MKIFKSNRVILLSSLTIPLILLTLVFLNFPSNAAGIIYVSKTATGNPSDGSSWNNAYTDLQLALVAASAGDEVWVAAGAYTPGLSTSDTFQLNSEVAIYGGFAATETARSQRDFTANLTVLSGDIGNNDTKDENGIVLFAADQLGDNSYHVVTGSNLSNSAVLDGFIITAGQADSSLSPNDSGGGMMLIAGSPTLSNLIITGNSAGIADSATGLGGGIYSDSSSSPILNNVVLAGNTAEYGGGMFTGGDASLTDVSFINNFTYWTGGGLYSSSGNPTLTNVLFSGNSTVYYGGGFDNESANPTLINVGFFGNSAGQLGGGMHNSITGGSLTNVSFSGNSSPSGGGLYIDAETTLSIVNSVLWNNSGSNGPNISNSSITTTISSSLIQGSGGSSSWAGGLFGADGGDNIDSDPLFVDPISPNNAPTTLGNYQLQLLSPAKDQGNTAAYTGQTAVMVDLAGNSRVQNSVIDMGAYEYTPPTIPIATNNSYTTNEDISLIGNVITDDTGAGADSDPNGDTISSTLESDVEYGYLILNLNGDFQYIPEIMDYAGSDSFVYKLTDGNSSAQVTATVSIMMTPVNDAPVAENDFLTFLGSPPHQISFYDLLENDSDIEFAQLQITAVGLPSFGGFESVDMQEGIIQYDPSLTEIGDIPDAATFTYTVSDGELDDTGLVTIQLDANVKVDSGFRPTVDGYSFANYALTKEQAQSPDATTLIEMFGAASVCKVGTLNEAGTDCIVDTHAVTALNKANGSTYGQAYGMLVTAGRFFYDLDTPSSILAIASDSVPTIVNNDASKKHIGRYTAQQATEPISGNAGWKRDLGIAEMVDSVKNGIVEQDPYLLLLNSKSNGNSLPLLPYLVEPTSTGYIVYVYDVNQPLNNSLRITIDLLENEWSYSTPPPSAVAIVFDGSDEDSHFDLRRLSGHQPTGLKLFGSSSQIQQPTDRAFDLFMAGEPMAFTAENCFAVSGDVNFNNSPDESGNCNSSSNAQNSGAFQCMRGADGLMSESNRSTNSACGMDGTVSQDMRFT
ncbi:MAG: hypothetical protein ACI9EW_003857, partial [Cellvibrionaceae bacterium]